MLFTSLLFGFIFVVNAAIPVCNGPQVFNAPHVGPSVIWYPVNYTNSEPPFFPDNFNCEYQINSPEGWYAEVSISLNYTENAQNETPVTVTDKLQRTEQKYPTSYGSFYFIGNGGKIKLSTGLSKVQFGFKVEWILYPRLYSEIEYVTAASTVPVIVGKLVVTAETTRITADTQVSATILPPIEEGYERYLRSVIFFDGFSTNSSNYLGTGMQLSSRNTQFVSSGRNMTIMYLLPTNRFTKVILQDYENTKDITQFQSMGFEKYMYGFTMNATNGPVAVQTLSYHNPSVNPNVITGLVGNGVLDVYLGGVTKNKTNLLTSYHTDNCQNYLPQLFVGTMKTYVLNSGVASLNITSNPSFDFPPTKAFGRKGIIVSGSYQTSATYDQDIYAIINSPVGYNTSVLRYSINYADLVPGVTLEIYGGYKNSVFYNSSNLPHLNLVSEISGGSEFRVSYSSNAKWNKGLYMSFEVLEKSARCASSLIFVVTLFMTMWKLVDSDLI